MRSIAERIRKRKNPVDKASRIEVFRRKYSKGIDFAVVGCIREGYSLMARCRKRKAWEITDSEKGKVGTPDELMPFFKFMAEAERLVKALNNNGIPAYFFTHIERKEDLP